MMFRGGREVESPLRSSPVFVLVLALACCVSCGLLLGIDDLPPQVLDGGSDSVSDTSDTTDVSETSEPCPTPSERTIHVSPTGGDGGNGSEKCPFKTITRAISTIAKASSTIILHHDGGTATYGANCTGGEPCDAMPIVVPISITGLTLTGDGAPDDVLVTGSTVFSVHGGGTSFANLTVTPTASPTSHEGILFEADAPPGPPSSIHDVVFRGSSPDGLGGGTGDLIFVRGAGHPTIGPSVAFERSTRAIRHEGNGELVITGTASAPVRISKMADACVRVTKSSGSVAMDYVELTDCGGLVPESAALEIDTPTSSRGTHVTITPGPLAAKAGGVLLRSSSTLRLEDSSIDTLLVPVRVRDASSLVLARVRVSGVGDGLSIDTSGSIDLDAVTSSDNLGSGIDCTKGTLKVRRSTMLGNTKSGLVVRAGCTLDLGSVSDAGDNVFDRTSKPNGYSGLCFTSVRTTTIVGATFACGWTSATCGSGTPSRLVVPDESCAIADVSSTTGSAITLLSVTCCK